MASTPTTVAEALKLSSDARVVTVGAEPYRIVHTNKAWHMVTGWKFTEVANMTSNFLQGPDTSRQTERDLMRALSTGKHTKVRLLNYTKSGEPFFNTLECFPLRDPKGALTHFCGVIRSEPAGSAYAPRSALPPHVQQQLLHEQVKQQQFLAAAEPDGAEPSEPRVPDEDEGRPAPDASRRPKRLRGQPVRIADAINNSSDAVVMTEPHPPYAITHVNQPWCVMCGYTQEEVEGMPNSILQGPETDKDILTDLMSSVQRGEPTSATLVNYKKGGVRFVNQVTVTPVYNDEDELEQFMAMLSEVG